MKQKNNQKLLIICGPTGTGKTDLGIYLAKLFNGEIISADSRQVYKNMNIGTGKKYSDEVSIWGYDLINADQEFSVSLFKDYAEKKIDEIAKRNKLPIVVGGTGFYIQAITNPMSNLGVPPNKELRSQLSCCSWEELYEKLSTIDSTRAKEMNTSDMKNPRRLIRAIEVSLSVQKEEQLSKSYSTLFVGLNSTMSELEKRLESSIKKRLDIGFEEEVKNLMGQKLSDMALSATGYPEFISYLEGKVSKDEAIESWKNRERQYIKRQLTWFKKIDGIHWFDISDTNYVKKVEQLVNSWNNK